MKLSLLKKQKPQDIKKDSLKTHLAVLGKDNINHLAFCLFSKQLHVSCNDENKIIPLENNKLETVLFDNLADILRKNHHMTCITIPAGPAPFTQLRILRAVQLGLATGFQCHTKMVNIFDILFSASPSLSASCLLETRRGDYFFQTRLENNITDEGLTNHIGANLSIISDNPEIATIKIEKNLAQMMVEKEFKRYPNLIYGITLPYATPPKA